MSAAAARTAEKGSTYLEQLKQAAEAQMRRPAPPLPAPKKHKQSKLHSSSTAGADSGDASGGEEGGGEGAAAAAERVGRYSYAAADAVLAGCSGFIGMCDFKRSNSATKELLDMLKAVLPGGVKLQLVKVGCRGLVVIALQQQQQQQQQQQEVAVQPAAVVAEVLARLEAGSMQRPRFCQRIAPVVVMLEVLPLVGHQACAVSAPC
ncbi:hypothetical protein OEZ86_013506 [Tetradesmus obliquus]|nr:hypothetical protein OEZ86_013506 [Tetradesmus obliquus]